MPSPKKINVALWTAQTLLAAVFLFAGGMKLIMPAAELAKVSPLPVWFIQFIGVAEVLGGLGMILPGVTRIRTGLTALAASGLVIIMIGAVVVTIATTSAVQAVLPFVVGVVAVAVAYGRWRVVPISGASRRLVWGAVR
jgi:hypothetical protein